MTGRSCEGELLLAGILHVVHYGSGALAVKSTTRRPAGERTMGQVGRYLDKRRVPICADLAIERDVPSLVIGFW